MNKLLLKSIMVLNGDTVSELAKDLDISTQSVYNKMNEYQAGEYKSEFTQGEIAFIANRYNMTAEQIKEVFFAELVS